jgi:hypothetical protein
MDEKIKKAMKDEMSAVRRQYYEHILMLSTEKEKEEEFARFMALIEATKKKKK